MELDVDNDHGASLWFDEFDYELALNDHSVASGLIDELGEVPGASTGVLAVPIDVSLFDAGLGIGDIVGSGAVDVGLIASTQVLTPFGAIPLRVDERGNLVLD